LDEQVEQAKTERILTNIFGRTRIFPRNCKFLPVWEREALNFLPQCVRKGSLVLTEHGYMPIENCDGIKVFDGEDFTSARLQGPRWKEEVKITTNFGPPLYTSEDHRVLVLTKDGIRERFVKELCPGELLMVPEVEASKEMTKKVTKFFETTGVERTGRKVEMYDLTVLGPR